MRKRLLSLILILALVWGMFPAPAAAADGAQITCSAAEAAPGDDISIEISGSQFENLAALELELYYDADALTFQSHRTQWMLDDAIVSVNTATPGVISLSFACAEGLTGDGPLLSLSFTVADDCPAGKYPLTLAAGEAYDVSLSPVSVSAKSGSITVAEQAPSYGVFYLGLELSTDTLAPGETLTATVCNEWYCGFASCDLTLHYDASMFRLESAAVAPELESAGAIYSLNTATPGLVRLSWVSSEQIWSHDLLDVKLQALEDVSGGSTICAEAADVYDVNRIPYAPGSASADVTVVPLDLTVVPELYLDCAPMVIGEECVSTLILSEGSNLAAADFRVEYDPAILECLAVEAAAESQFLVINPNFTDGVIRFSFVEEAGVTDETPLVTIRWRPRTEAASHYAIQTTLIDPVDANLETVEIDCPVQTGCVFLRETIEPTCAEPGGLRLRCVGCGNSVLTEPTPALGHQYGEPVFHWSENYESCSASRVCDRDDSHIWQVDCTVTHVSVGESCTEPGSITYTATADFYGETYTDSQTIYKDALGHDYAWTMITEPDCVSQGLRHGECIRCDATCEEPVAPLGHDHAAEVTVPGCTEGGFTTHTCKRCGDCYVDSHTDPLGHDWNGLVCKRCGETRENPFVDVPEGSFYYDPVLWAVENGITNGVDATHFGPNDSCMRAHVVTFLWRAAGSPEPQQSHNPFVDVKATDFYYKPVLWAVENGITNGLDATHFGPFAYCNRAQVVTFLHRALGNPEPASSRNPFTDVPDGSFYHKPVLWAVENGVTNGLSATTFGPTAICNRAQIVTFLYRAFT